MLGPFYYLLIGSESTEPAGALIADLLGRYLLMIIASFNIIIFALYLVNRRRARKSPREG